MDMDCRAVFFRDTITIADKSHLIPGRTLYRKRAAAITRLAGNAAITPAAHASSQRALTSRSHHIASRNQIKATQRTGTGDRAIVTPQMHAPSSKIGHNYAPPPIQSRNSLAPASPTKSVSNMTMILFFSASLIPRPLSGEPCKRNPFYTIPGPKRQHGMQHWITVIFCFKARNIP